MGSLTGVQRVITFWSGYYSDKCLIDNKWSYG